MTNENIKPMAALVTAALTEIKAPSTPAKPKITTYPPLTRANFGPPFQTLNDHRLELAFTAAAQFAQDVNNRRPYWLTLCGVSGTGKTHLAKMLYRHFMGASRFNLDYDPKSNKVTGNSGQFCCWRKTCSDIKQGDYGLIEDLSDDWFVVLDDIGTAHDPSGFIASALDRILNSRLRKWTVITCNFGLKEIADRMDVRIASRMLRDDSIVIELSDVPDFNTREQCST